MFLLFHEIKLVERMMIILRCKHSRAAWVWSAKDEERWFCWPACSMKERKERWMFVGTLSSSCVVRLLDKLSNENFVREMMIDYLLETNRKTREAFLRAAQRRMSSRFGLDIYFVA